MSRTGENPEVCGAARAELAELALGVLSGRERSAVLEHVATCERCAAELEQLSIVADTMLQLTPEAEPPLGFDERLVERLRADGPLASPRRLRRTTLFAAAAAAAVVAIALGAGIGTLATNRPDGGASQSALAGLTTAQLTSAGRVLGEVFVSHGTPAWLFMTIDSDAASGVVKCTVSLADGTVETVGTFRLSGGYGAWGSPLSAEPGEVRSAQLVAADGTVLARAVL